MKTNWSDIKNKPRVLDDPGFLSSLKRSIITITNKVESTGNAIINIENNVNTLNGYSRIIISDNQPENLRDMDIWVKPKIPIGV